MYESAKKTMKVCETFMVGVLLMRAQCDLSGLGLLSADRVPVR